MIKAIALLYLLISNTWALQLNKISFVHTFTATRTLSLHNQWNAQLHVPISERCSLASALSSNSEVEVSTIQKQYDWNSNILPKTKQISKGFSSFLSASYVFLICQEILICNFSF